MVTAYNIGLSGEIETEKCLQSKGHLTRRNTKLLGSTDIEVFSPDRVIIALVQVKTAQSPSLASELSQEEAKNIKSRAAKIGAKPYLAKVQLPALYPILGVADVKFHEVL